MPVATDQTRKQRRDAARRQRAEAERRDALAAARRRRLARLGAVLAAAALVVAGLVVVSSGSSSRTAASAGPPAGVRESSALLAGIPQDGVTLGNANASVRVVEFADLQCPFCREASAGVLPGVIRDYVRPGKVRMDFRALTFIGDDSVRAARFASAAAAQDKLWNVVDLLYANQGAENSGWATDALLRRIAGAVPGLDAARVFGERASAQVTENLSAAESLAARNQVNQTPTFLVGRGASVQAVDAAGLRAAIKAALRS
jgi:protein-disulfide isomerase